MTRAREGLAAYSPQSPVKLSRGTSEDACLRGSMSVGRSVSGRAAASASCVGGLVTLTCGCDGEGVRLLDAGGPVRRIGGVRAGGRVDDAR
jgi:hypothetical protein